MDPLLDYRARLLKRLETVVHDLADAVAAIPAERWHEPIGRGGRSAHAIVARLRDTERDAYLVRLQKMLADHSPSFEAYPHPSWESRLYNRDEPMTSLLADYAALREAELQILRPLSREGWARSGRHPSLGLHTVQWWVEQMLKHALASLNELRLT